MSQRWLIEERLTHSVIGAFYEVYNALGYGFLEHVYVTALDQELRDRGHQVSREVGIAVTFKGREIASQRLDMVVDQRVVVETKSTLDLHKAAHRQIYNYLRSTRMEVGLLLHFGPEPKFYRIVNSNARKQLAHVDQPLRQTFRRG